MKTILIKNKIPIIIISIAFIIFCIILSITIIHRKTNISETNNLNNTNILEDLNNTENKLEVEEAKTENITEESVSTEETSSDNQETIKKEEIVSNDNKKVETSSTPKTSSANNSNSSQNSNNSNKNNNSSSNNSNNNSNNSSSSSSKTETPKQEEVTPPVITPSEPSQPVIEEKPKENVITYARNSTYIAKLKNAIEKYSSQNDLIAQYGYTATENASIVNGNDYFTFSENNVARIVINGGIKYNYYARDYFVNGEYKWTECYLVSVSSY